MYGIFERQLACLTKSPDRNGTRTEAQATPGGRARWRMGLIGRYRDSRILCLRRPSACLAKCRLLIRHPREAIFNRKQAPVITANTITRGLAILVLALTAIFPVAAESIEGTVVIKKRLTKPRVTAAVPLYERGAVVELGADAENDPLEFERSRVAVYLEGQDPLPALTTPIVVKMEQVNRRFSPEILVISAGSEGLVSKPGSGFSQRLLPFKSEDVRPGQLPEGRHPNGDVCETRYRLRELPSARKHDRDDCCDT